MSAEQASPAPEPPQHRGQESWERAGATRLNPKQERRCLEREETGWGRAGVLPDNAIPSPSLAMTQWRCWRMLSLSPFTGISPVGWGAFAGTEDVRYQAGSTQGDEVGVDSICSCSNALLCCWSWAHWGSSLLRAMSCSKTAWQPRAVQGPSEASEDKEDSSCSNTQCKERSSSSSAPLGLK